MDRRKFIASGFVVIAAACGKSPVAPDAPEPTPPQNIPQPSPNPLKTEYGVLHKEAKAGLTGTIEEVLTAAQLKPTLNNLGLLTHLNGRAAPTIPGCSESNGFYFIHINGQYFGSGSAREKTITQGEWWGLYDWNGKDKPS